MTKQREDQLEKALIAEQDRSERLKRAMNDIAADLERIDVEGRETLIMSIKLEVRDALMTYEDLKRRFGGTV